MRGGSGDFGIEEVGGVGENGFAPAGEGGGWVADADFEDAAGDGLAVEGGGVRDGDKLCFWVWGPGLAIEEVGASGVGDEDFPLGLAEPVGEMDGVGWGDEESAALGGGGVGEVDADGGGFGGGAGEDEGAVAGLGGLGEVWVFGELEEGFDGGGFRGGGAEGGGEESNESVAVDGCGGAVAGEGGGGGEGDG